MPSVHASNVPIVRRPGEGEGAQWPVYALRVPFQPRIRTSPFSACCAHAGTHEASIRTRPSLMGPPARPISAPFREFESVSCVADVANSTFASIPDQVALLMPPQEALLSLDRSRPDESLMAELTGHREACAVDRQGLPVGVEQVRRTASRFRILPARTRVGMRNEESVAAGGQGAS